MSRGVAVLGLNGAGKSTLAHALARELDLFEMDVEDYYFPEQRKSRRAALEGRPDPDPSKGSPFSAPRSKAEVEAAILRDMERHPSFVLSGVTANWGPEVLSRVGLVLLLKAPAAERVRRVEERERARFGSRVLPGGDMFEQQAEFRRQIASREESDAEQSAENVGCPVTVLDGTASPEEVLSQALRAVKEFCNSSETGKTLETGSEKRCPTKSFC